MSIQLKEIKLKDGTAISPAPITIVVGANNCGKTRFLKEIKEYLYDNRNFEFRILDKISSKPGDLDEVVDQLNIRITQSPDGHNTSYHTQGYFGRINSSGQTSYFNTMREDVSKSGLVEHALFRNTFGQALVAMIQTEDRLLASKHTNVHPEGIGFLDTLYKSNSSIDAEVTTYTKAYFGGLEVTLDSSQPGYLGIRVGTGFSKLPLKDRDARPYLESYAFLEDQGDGFRSFVTTLYMLHVADRPFILIDEPEAFLHPPQAAALGRIIASLTASSQSIFISTHSADFLRGIITQRQEVNILRLTRTKDSTSGHVLNAKEISAIIQTPLLNSSRVLDSLFYQGVVIMEGDSDRTFYEKIAHENFSDQEIHYIHAHSKQAIHRLITPYVQVNVGFAVIVDFDILREREDLKKLIEATGEVAALTTILGLQKKIQDSINLKPATKIYHELAETLHKRTLAESELPAVTSLPTDQDKESEKRIFDLKRDVKNALEASDKWAEVKASGRAKLSPGVVADFDALDTLCRSIGIFIVPCGSLESWLSQHVPLVKNKTKWITDALIWLDEHDTTDLEVANFISAIHTHITKIEKSQPGENS